MSILISLSEVTYLKNNLSGNVNIILDHISLDIYKGEKLAILGRSGSGKTTLLSIMAGLLKPSEGTIKVHQDCLTTSMVEQVPVLLPWLTIYENIELSIESNSNISPNEKVKRTWDVLNLIGIEGFASHYPDDLSMGMKQRASIARAVIRHPDIIFLDEPTSLLDSFTADTLWSYLLSLWYRGTIVFITHNPEEALYYANRIIVLDGSETSQKGSGIGGIIIPKMLSQPINYKSNEFQNYIDEIYRLLTKSDTLPTLTDRGKLTILCDVEVDEIFGLLMCIHDLDGFNKELDIAVIAEESEIDLDTMMESLDAIHGLSFIIIGEGSIKVTEAGKEIFLASSEERVKLFAQAMKNHLSYTNKILEAIERKKKLSRNEMINLLGNDILKEQSTRVINVFIKWSIYAELFSYDAINDFAYPIV